MDRAPVGERHAHLLGKSVEDSVVGAGRQPDSGAAKLSKQGQSILVQPELCQHIHQGRACTAPAPSAPAQGTAVRNTQAMLVGKSLHGTQK